MITANERRQIISEIRSWVTRVPPVPGFGFLQETPLMTPAEVLQAVEKETPDGMAILQIIEHNLRRTSLSYVLLKIRTLPPAETLR